MGVGYCMDENNCGIYMIKNLVNNKVYVGQSKELDKRFKRHINELKNNNHHSIHLQRAWNKYGEDSFDFIILEYCVEDELDEKEIYWIDHYNACDYDSGYNNKEGGSHGKYSEESKRKMSESSKGQKCPEWLKEHFSQLYSGEGNPMYGRAGELSPNYGKFVSEETRKKISEANKGKIVTEEQKEKISNSLKGRFIGELNPFYGKQHTEKTKERLREINLGKTNSEETRKKISQNNIGKKYSKETKDKIRLSKLGNKNPFYNKTHSNEQKEKWSKERRKYNEETVIEIRKDIKNGIGFDDLFYKYNITKGILRKIKKYIKPYDNKEVS